MGELSMQILEGRLPLLPGWPGYAEATARRLEDLSGAAVYLAALTAGELSVLDRARARDPFARVRGLVAGWDGTDLREWFLALVDAHEGCLLWAVEAAQRLAD